MRKDMLPAARVKRITDEATGQDLSSKECFEFLPSIVGRAFLSDAQERWLSQIERRIFKTDDEDEEND
jgi:hypothetical protein